MEGSWVGDRTEESFEVCGYTALAEKYGVQLIDAQKEPAVIKNCSGMELHLCRCATETDFMINVPVMKGHCQTHITCALKNMKGLLPNKEKRVSCGGTAQTDCSSGPWHSSGFILVDKYLWGS